MRLDSIIVGVRRQKSEDRSQNHDSRRSRQYGSTPSLPSLSVVSDRKSGAQGTSRHTRPAAHPKRQRPQRAGAFADFRFLTSDFWSTPDDHSPLDPPLPIPNRTVKRRRADDSTDCPCESRSLSGTHQHKARSKRPGLVLCAMWCSSRASQCSALLRPYICTASI